MATISEKPGDASHDMDIVEDPAVEKFSKSDEDIVMHADASSLPPGYFTSTFFLGTMAASGFAIAGVC